MTQAQAHAVIRWFAGCGDRYVRAFLSHIDVPRLTVDRDYGLKLFLFAWAFERAGAPRAYRIAAVKAVSSLKASRRELPALFGKFCLGKQNPRANPVIDPRIAELDVRSIVQLVRQGALDEAFQRLDLKGIGHKLRAFFLRDLVTLLKVEPKLGSDPEALLWCQPIDVWVRFAAEELCSRARTFPPVPKASAKYRLSRADLEAARGIVGLSIEAGVSPLKVNQGIWYFSANAVSDEKRLRELIRCGDGGKLDAELGLMAGFLPAQPMWG